MKDPHGFSLLEMLLVLAILGLLVSIGMVRLWPMLRKSRNSDIIEQIQFADASLRQACIIRGQPAELIVDIDTRQLILRNQQTILQHYSLPKGYHFGQVQTAGIRRERGELHITFGPRGRSPSYAVQICEPEGSQWIFVAGLSGQIRTCRQEQEIRNYWESLQSKRVDSY